MFTTSTMRIRPNFPENTLLKVLAGFYFCVWIAAAINPVYPADWVLENILVSPDAGEAYLGTLGDVWDAQKDMGLAALGAIICMFITAMIRSRRKKPHTPDYSLE